MANMTNEEAIQKIRKKCEGHDCGFCGKGNNCELYLAISALKKQIPKKPRGILQSQKFKSARCKICNEVVFDYWKGCPECLNAIDWSESNG